MDSVSLHKTDFHLTVMRSNPTITELRNKWVSESPGGHSFRSWLVKYLDISHLEVSYQCSEIGFGIVYIMCWDSQAAMLKAMITYDLYTDAVNVCDDRKNE
jgi:hypothetical protein